MSSRRWCGSGCWTTRLASVNGFIAAIGFDKIPFFGDAAWAIPTIAMVNVWRHMGYTALLVFAGLQTIPDYVCEAASVDGSTEWQSFWRITSAAAAAHPGAGVGDHGDRIVPGLRHRGRHNEGRAGQRQPRDAVLTSTKKGFAEGQFGYASALSVILFIILATVALIQLRLLRRRRVGPGLRGSSYGNHNRSLSLRRSRDAAARPRGRRSIVGRGGRLGRNDPSSILITLFPFYWMIRTRVLDLEVAVLRPRTRCCRSISPWARVQADVGPRDAGRGAGRGAEVGAGQLLRSSCATRSSTPRCRRLVRCSSARWRRTHLPGSAGPGGTRSSSCSDRADDPADLRHAAELHLDQEPRAASTRSRA